MQEVIVLRSKYGGCVHKVSVQAKLFCFFVFLVVGPSVFGDGHLL